ncbi:MAG TPA: hypothetical protein VFD37_04190, partial [Solirubrobacterales bacterium]|nr:hypothetical protein [Solirubrobacterales bacterium]
MERPSPLLAAAHLAALWALAFAQPLLELLGRNTVFFVARGTAATEIIAFALLLCVAPLLIFWAVGALLRRLAPAVGWGVHLALFALLAVCLALQLLGELAQRPAGLLIAAAAGLGLALTLLYARRRFFRSLMDVLTPAPAVVLVLFLVLGPTAQLAFPAEEPGAIEARVERPAPVVIVILDELPAGSLLDRAGRIDATRYPALAGLARESTWYRNATTVGAFTSIAVPAILTGRVPADGELPIAAEQPESLFTLLGDTYGMNVREDATKLCPDRLCPEAEADRTISSGLGPLFADVAIVSQHLLLPEALREGLPDISETFG